MALEPTGKTIVGPEGRKKKLDHPSVRVKWGYVKATITLRL